MLAPLQILLYRLIPLQVGIKGLVGMYGVIFVTGLAPLEILLNQLTLLEVSVKDAGGMWDALFLTVLGNESRQNLGIPKVTHVVIAYLRYYRYSKFNKYTVFIQTFQKFCDKGGVSLSQITNSSYQNYNQENRLRR